MRVGKVFLTLLIALAFMGLVWATTAAASDASLGISENEIEFWGVIQDIYTDTAGTGSLVVNGLTVTVDETTEIKEGDEHLELADLEVGWTVKVEGLLQTDGTVMAEEIKVVSREPVTPPPTSTITPTVTPTVTITPTVTPTITPTPTVTPTLEGAHPVALALASYFDILYDEIIGWHEDGVGFGNMAKAYFLVEALGGEGLTVEQILDEKLSGTGWGQILKALGLSPSSKDRNLGRVMSGRGDKDDDNGAQGEVLAGTDERPDKDKEKDNTPPGRDKDRAPPGREKKDKNKGKGRGKP